MAERDIISFKDGKAVFTPRENTPTTSPQTQEVPKKPKDKAKPQAPGKDAE